MIRGFAAFVFALMVLLVPPAAATQVRGPAAEGSIQGIYDVRVYGNVVLLLLNRSALRFVNGFWVAEGLNMVDLAQQILSIAGGYTVEGARVAITNGNACVIGYNGSCIEMERLGDDFAYVVSALVRAGLRSGSLELYRHSDKTLRILVGMGVVESLDTEKIVNAFSTLNRKVVVQEVVALGRIPSCFETPELCNAAVSTTCFTSFAETAYGLQITLGYNCVRKLAEEGGTSIDEALGPILERLKPLVDKYLGQRPLVALVPEVRGVPLPGEPTPITSTTSRAEDLQPLNAISSTTTATTSTWTSTSTPTNTRNPEFVGIDGNTILMTAAVSATTALILVFVSRLSRRH